MMTVSISPLSDEFHAYQVRNGYEWMDVIIRTRPNPSERLPDSRSHTLMIHSSFGSWSYTWSHAGRDPWWEWFSKRPFDTLMGKLMGQDFTVETSTEDVWSKVKGRLMEDVRSGRGRFDPSREGPKVRDFIQKVRAELDTDTTILELFDILDKIEPDTWSGWDFDLQKVNPVAKRFWEVLWTPFAESLKNAAHHPALPVSPEHAEYKWVLK